MSNTKKARCAWVTDDPIYIDYHDQEWGVPIHDDQLLFEFLILEGMQAGLSWLTVLKKRQHFRSAFDQFIAEKITRYDEHKINSLMENAGIIRHKLKIEAVIQNAKAYLTLQDQEGGFSNYLWQFTDGRVIHNHRKAKERLPSSTPLSDKLSKDLKSRGFKFVGTTICYAFLQAVGVVNDHTIDCFRYQAILNQAKKTR